MTIQGSPDRTIRDCGDITDRPNYIPEEPRLHQARPYEYAEEIGAAWWHTHPDGLDRTPVGDLEGWHADYDPVRAAELDALLDERFGPTGGAS